MDLSFPRGASVNAGIASNTYLGTDFLLCLPNIDNITAKVKKFGRGSLIFKVYISRAFRHVKVDPRDYPLLGLSLDSHYFDTCVPFGYRHGSAIFQRLTDAIRYIMATKNYHITNYIDDLVGNATVSKANAAFECLCDLLVDLGFEVSKKKLVRPATTCICLGVEINTREFTVSIPEEKLREIINLCKSWLGKQTCTKKELQSLLGSLLYITKCVRVSRVFLNRMLDLLRAADKQQKIALTQPFLKDLHWFQTFLPQFNGTAFFDHPRVQGEISLDASLVGLGAHFENAVYAIPLDRGYLGFDIVHLEMLNILVALRTWKKRWGGKRILIHCDNNAVISVINTGKTRDNILAALARNIAMEAATADIHISTIHILGKHNVIADCLSRWYSNESFKQKIAELLPNPTWLQIPPQFLGIDWSI